MNQIKDAMLTVFQDVVYSQLHPKVRQQFEDAIRHMDDITPFIANMMQRGQVLTNQIEKAQTIKWIGFKTPQGRQLSREVDGFPKCSNTRLPQLSLPPRSL